MGIEEMVMDGVREYGDELPVSVRRNQSGRLVVVALNEAGCCCTEVDLFDLLDWAKHNDKFLGR